MQRVPGADRATQAYPILLAACTAGCTLGLEVDLAMMVHHWIVTMAVVGLKNRAHEACCTPNWVGQAQLKVACPIDPVGRLWLVQPAVGP